MCWCFSAHIARWCAESNRPLNIIKDRQFQELMTARRPSTSIPSPKTVFRDVKVAFEWSRQRIDKIMKVCITLFYSISSHTQHYHRNIPVKSILGRTHGPQQITARSLHGQCISTMKAQS
jgi:hypothetical protein